MFRKHLGLYARFSARMLPMTAEFIAPSVCKVFNIKQVNFRKDGNDLQLCLSVSVFTVLSKFLECYMYGIITNHLQTFHPLAESQWRFLPGKSTVTGLLTTTHNWLSILQGGGEIGAFSFKLRKAVDSTPHEVLLKKDKRTGMGNPILPWITDYLICREQKVVVNGAESQHTTVLSGVLQGLVLGPLLSLIYIDDLARLPLLDGDQVGSMQMTCYCFAQFRVRKTINACRVTS